MEGIIGTFGFLRLGQGKVKKKKPSFQKAEKKK